MSEEHLLRNAIRNTAWAAYTWPKGKIGNAIQGKILAGVEVPRTRKAIKAADHIVLVHTPGKVGSKAIAFAVKTALPAPQTAVFHTHRINIERRNEMLVEWASDAPRRTFYTAGEVGRFVSAPSYKRTTVLTAIRDPMERNISAFFQSSEHYMPDHKPVTDRHLNTWKSIAEMFVECFPHTWQDTWIEQELHEPFGFNIYGQAFSPEDGYQIVTHEGATLGIIRHDYMHTIAAPRMLSLILEEPIDRLPQVNTSSTKPYDAIYKKFKNELRLPRDTLEHIYATKFAKQFFSELEREMAIDRWSD